MPSTEYPASPPPSYEEVQLSICHTITTIRVFLVFSSGVEAAPWASSLLWCYGKSYWTETSVLFDFSNYQILHIVQCSVNRKYLLDLMEKHHTGSQLSVLKRSSAIRENLSQSIGLLAKTIWLFFISPELPSLMRFPWRCWVQQRHAWTAVDAEGCVGENNISRWWLGESTAWWWWDT